VDDDGRKDLISMISLKIATNGTAVEYIRREFENLRKC
jgi:hypothetical protein